MSKIVLICTDESPAAMGIKVLSSNLARHGFDTAIVVMANWEDHFKNFRWEDLRELSRDAGLIGISCMTHGLKKAIEVKKALLEHVKAPVIIGGIHATLEPESLLDDFDLICHGEGEDLVVALAERLANGESFSDIPGLWGRLNGKIFKNPAQPLNQDINDYPFPDYDLHHQYIFESNRLVPMEPSHIICDYFEVMGSRGCPHVCTFCSNQKLKQDFPWRKRVRQYTIDYFISHLKEICRVYPVVRSFWLEDDTFFAKESGQVREFAERYKKEIHRPFCVLISPWTYSEEKVRLLVEAGMNRLIFGVQSGSENTNDNIYGRKITNDKMLEIIHSLNRFRGLTAYYDFIGMNPFETADDLMNTIRFVRKFPTPFFIFSNNLAFYPGTKIRERALEAGLDITKRDRHTDAKHGYSILKDENIKHKLFHFIFLMMGGKANKFKIGLVPRALVSDSALQFYCFLDKRAGHLADGIVSFLSSIMIYADWKVFLKKLLNRKQIEKLKKMYHKFFK